MNVFALTIGDRSAGSTKFRLVQYEPFLNERGIRVEYVQRNDIDRHSHKRANASDLVFNQKCLFNRGYAQKIISSAKAVVFDFDDAIYTRPGRPYSWVTRIRVTYRLMLWLKKSTVVTVANHQLAAFANKHHGNVVILPMSVNLETWHPGKRPSGQDVVVGWAGGPGNIAYIESLDPVLCRLHAIEPGFKLKIYCGIKPKLECPYEYVPFKDGTEADFVRTLDVGLLPLPDDEYSRGKSPIKAIQYLACGVPIVGNAIGATAEIFKPEFGIPTGDDEDWYTAIRHLIHSPEKRASMGRLGAAFIERHHNYQRTANRLAALLLSLAT